MKKLVIAMLAASCAIPAMAADGYAGAGIGRAEQKISADGLDMSAHSTSFKVFGGFQLDPMWGLEAGLVDFGKATISGGGATVSFEPTSLYLAGTGSVPLTQTLSAYAKLGVARTHTKGTATMGGMTDTESTNHTSPMFGIGVRFMLDPKWSLFAEYENFGKVVNEDGGCLKVDHVAIGARFNF